MCVKQGFRPSRVRPERKVQVTNPYQKLKAEIDLGLSRLEQSAAPVGMR